MQKPTLSMTLLGRAIFAGPVNRESEPFTNVVARALTEKVIDAVRARADLKDVDLFVHCGCEELWVKPRAFSGAIHELLDNAIDASRRGHPIILDLRRTSDGDLLCQVQDAGEGMGTPVLTGLVQRPREPNVTSGIARAWAVVEDHGGLIRFESALGVGTTVTVWLPGTPDSLSGTEMTCRQGI